MQIVLKHQWGFRKSNNNRWYIFIVLKSLTISICMDIFATKYFTTEFFKKALKILQKSYHRYLQLQPQISCVTPLNKLFLEIVIED